MATSLYENSTIYYSPVSHVSLWHGRSCPLTPIARCIISFLDPIWCSLSTFVLSVVFSSFPSNLIAAPWSLSNGPDVYDVFGRSLLCQLDLPLFRDRKSFFFTGFVARLMRVLRLSQSWKAGGNSDRNSGTFSRTRPLQFSHLTTVEWLPWHFSHSHVRPPSLCGSTRTSHTRSDGCEWTQKARCSHKVPSVS